MCPRSHASGLMIGEVTAVRRSSSRCATSANVRSRTSPITACSSSTTRLTIHTRSYGAAQRYGSDQAAEPAQAEAAGRDQQRQRTARERRSDLALLRARAQARAEVGVDLLDLVGLGGGVGLAAGDAGDLLQRLGVRRDLHPLQ